MLFPNSCLALSLFFSQTICLRAHAQDAQLPLHASPDELVSSNSPSPLRVAIIGAGAAGASTAYHLSLYSNQSWLISPSNISITVFDSAARPGGRTTTVNALDDPRYPVELGASIFVKINHILYEASRDFGLETNNAKPERPARSDWGLGVWDGEKFVFKQASSDGDEEGGGGSWLDWKGLWDIAKLLWRYGLSPVRTRSATKNVIGRFLKFYDKSEIFPFASLTQAVAMAGLLDVTGANGVDVLNKAGVSEAFQREIIQASTRVNYGQNLAEIHGLEALVCMATDDAMSVKGGNWQIFEAMMKRSIADFRPNSTVTSILKLKEFPESEAVYQVQTTSYDPSTHSFEETSSHFDSVILAAPYQFSNITFFPPLAQTPAEIPYVRLHVTLFTTPHRISPSFFGLNSTEDVPSMILTTLPTDTQLPPGSRGRDAVGPAGFWSISSHGTISTYVDPDGTSTPTPQYLYKIFSPSPLTGTWLASLLGFEYQNKTVDDSLPAMLTSRGWADPVRYRLAQDITWLHERAWHSYPYETPRREFERIRLEDGWPGSSSDDDDDDGPLGRGVWYTSGMESFISTMETSALMGKNVGRLIIDELEYPFIRQLVDKSLAREP